MKKSLTVVTLLMLFCSTLFGQKHWTFTQGHHYPRTMEVNCLVSINGELQTGDVEIAAFSNNVLRSNGATLIPTPWGDHYAQVTVQGNSNGEAINFKLFANGEELDSDHIVSFVIDGVIGSAFDPITIDFYETHYDQPGYFSNTMAVIAAINIDGNLVNEGAYELAAYCGDQIRGVARPYKEEINGEEVYVALLSVGANVDGETISFKLWDFANEIELDAISTMTFVTDAMIGDPDPYVMYFFNDNAPAVAKIGEQYYTSLSDAVAAAVDGDVITFIQNAEGAGVEINKSVTIDFANFTYMFEEPAAGTAVGLNILKGEGTANDVTLKNGNFIVSETAGLNMLVENYADLTIENVSLNGQNLTDNSYVLSFVSGEVNINNSEIVANSVEGETHYAFRTMNQDGFSAPVVNLWYDAEQYLTNGVVSYTNTITGLVEYTGGSILGNTNEMLDVVAKKQFTKTDGTGREGWGTLSTPVYTEGTNGIAIPEIGTAAHDLYKYNEPTANWLFYQGALSPFTTFDLGRGYLYANAEEDYMFELQGKLANGKAVSFDITYSLESAQSFAGFNFIGNPYACNIDHNHITLEGYKHADGFYVVSEEGALIPCEIGQAIKPMESVMLQLIPVSETSKSSNLRAKMTIHPYPVVKERSSEVNGSLAINVSNENYNDVAYVSFSENIGLNKVAHYNEEIPMVSVSVDGADFAIAMMSQDVTEIPVSFKAAQMGEYTIGVEARDCEYSTMTLVDRLSGIETNLLLEDYTFMAKSGDNSDRFVIRLAKDNGSNNGSENFAYINNGMMYINNIAGQAVINVYDVTGRPVAEYNVAESASISTSDFAAGMYIIRMSDENGVKVQKIIVE